MADNRTTRPYQLGIALSGGSIKGFAHLGVLKYLDEVGLRPEIIAGTSAGSIMGAFFASGYAPEEIHELLSQTGFMQMTSFTTKGGGIFSTTKFLHLLKKNLRHRKLEDLPTPMRIVATDLNQGEPHVFTEGPLAKIILASSSIPILFCPVEIDGHTYVDGGLFRNFPVTAIREDCEEVIGMNLGPVQSAEIPMNIKDIANRAWELIFRQNTTPDCAACDYLLETSEVMKFGMFEVSASEQLMKIGYELAKAELAPLVKKKKDARSLSPATYHTYAAEDRHLLRPHSTLGE